MTLENETTRAITRRAFLKRAAIIGTAVGGTVVLGTSGKLWWDDNTRQTLLTERNRRRPTGSTQWLTQRNRRRPTGSTQWLTQPEYVLLAALASILVPSDERGPGAPEAAVVDTIDRLIATSPARQAQYAPGLLAFDEIAQQTYGAIFVDLVRAQQEDLVEAVDAAAAARASAGTVADRVVRKVTSTAQALQGVEAAVVLFPVLVNDVKQAFYTSEVAWQWLDYDGPPMPKGYAGVVGEGC